jgi:16S rRNA (guanine1207-N2)-methyltransferase
MVSAPSQVLVRNSALFDAGKWLLVNPTESDIFSKLENSNIFGFHQYYDVFQDCVQSQGPEKHTFAAYCKNNQTYDGAVIYMPKAKEQAVMLIANMAACVKEGGMILLVGENKSGIKSGDKLLQKVSGRVNKIDSARHCVLYCAQLEKNCPFNLDDWINYKEIRVKDITCSIAFSPGVFSSGELDVGTKLLLENIPPRMSGEILDFACGAGVIGCFVAKQCEKINLTLCDVSALAILCTELSLAKNKIDAKVIASDGLSDIKGTFDYILTNPPFHSGIKTDYAITQTFIQQVKQRMHSKSSLILVANRFLPYPDLLKAALGRVKTIAQTTKFNLYFS